MNLVKPTRRNYDIAETFANSYLQTPLEFKVSFRSITNLKKSVYFLINENSAGLGNRTRVGNTPAVLSR